MRNQGTLRIALACAALMGSLGLVVYRQSRAFEVLRALDGARHERVLLESVRASTLREIEKLESRSRIVAVAGERLGLHVPNASEIVILQLPATTPSRDRSLSRVALEVR